MTERGFKDFQKDPPLQRCVLVRSALLPRAIILVFVAFTFWVYPAVAIDPRLFPPIPQPHPDVPPGFEVVIPRQYKEMWSDYLRLRDNPGTSMFAISEFKKKYASLLQNPELRMPYWSQYKVSVQNALENVYAGQYTVRQDIVAGKDITNNCTYPLRVHNGQLFLADSHHQFARYATARPDGSIIVTVTRHESGLRPRVPLKDLAIVEDFEGWFTRPTPGKVIRTVGGPAKLGKSALLAPILAVAGASCAQAGGVDPGMIEGALSAPLTPADLAFAIPEIGWNLLSENYELPGSKSYEMKQLAEAYENAPRVFDGITGIGGLDAIDYDGMYQNVDEYLPQDVPASQVPYLTNGQLLNLQSKPDGSLWMPPLR